MDEKEIKLSNGRVVTVKEMKYKDLIANATDDKLESAKSLIRLSTDLTDEDFDNLSMKDGVLLQKTISDINGLTENFL